MNLTVIKKDLTFYGIINIILYMFGSFLLLPFINSYFKMKISLLNYVIWYAWSIGYSFYVLYILNKQPDKRNNIENVTYNWFIKGGFTSYQNMFLLSELEPLSPMLTSADPPSALASPPSVSPISMSLVTSPDSAELSLLDVDSESALASELELVSDIWTGVFTKGGVPKG